MRKEASRNKEAKAQWNLYVPLTVPPSLPKAKSGEERGPSLGMQLPPSPPGTVEQDGKVPCLRVKWTWRIFPS